MSPGAGCVNCSISRLTIALVDICGPEFIGYHLLSGAEFSTQVVAKREPSEGVGNVVQVDGRLIVIEYSELPDDAAKRRNADGSLEIWAGSIAVHMMDAGLLRRLARSGEPLPFHVAHKKVACIDESGHRLEPTEPNAIKFEQFIFDLMPRAERAVVVEVDRQRAFGPVKNAPVPAAVRPSWHGRKWRLSAASGSARPAPRCAKTYSSRSVRCSPWTPMSWRRRFGPVHESPSPRILAVGRIRLGVTM